MACLAATARAGGRRLRAWSRHAQLCQELLSSTCACRPQSRHTGPHHSVAARWFCGEPAAPTRNVQPFPGLGRGVEHRLIQKVLDHIAAGTTDMVPQQGSVPVEPYLTPSALAAEQAGIFRQAPLIAGRAAMAPTPGDYAAVTVAGVPVLLVRSKSGSLRAFMNVCRHRGTKLASGCGHKKGGRFVCPYHGWQYGADTGRLLKITDAFGFPDVDKATLSLVRLPCTERFGFAWVHLQGGGGSDADVDEDGAPLVDVDAFLGPDLVANFTALGLERLVEYRPSEVTRSLNWKLALDVFLESYHVRYAHSRSIYPLFLDNVGVFERLGGVHMRNLFPKRSIADLATQPKSSWALRPHCNVLYYVYPNTLLLIQPDHVSVNHMYPVDPSHTSLFTSTLLDEEPTGSAQRYYDKNIEIFQRAIAEDLELGEGIQDGFASGANERLTLGRFEQSLVWFHQQVAQASGRNL